MLLTVDNTGQYIVSSMMGTVDNSGQYVSSSMLGTVGNTGQDIPAPCLEQSTIQASIYLPQSWEQWAILARIFQLNAGNNGHYVLVYI